MLFSFLKKGFDFFLFTSLFIALCATGMIYQTWLLFHLPLVPDFLYFVYFGTLCSYNFHWYLTPALYGGTYRTKWSTRNKQIHFSFFFIGLAGCGWMAIQLLDYWPWLLATGFITFLYSAPKIPFKLFTELKKIAIGKTIFLSLVWTHVTVLMPLILHEINWEAQHYIFAVNRFVFIYSICILFDYRDRAEDKKEGIKSLITLLAEKNINRLFYFSMLVFFGTTISLYLSGMPFNTCLALAIPGFVLALIYNYAKASTSDYFYYFFLDGLMMFSLVLLYFFSFSYI